MTVATATRMEEAEARRALKAVPFPSEIIAYDLKFSEGDTEPALWVTFRTTIPDGLPRDEVRAVASRMNEFADAARDALLDTLPGRYPFFAFAPAR